jgi:antitoxin component of MazEF toxin-antitoxin module
MIELKLRKFGNSLGAVLPKEAVARLNVGDGERLYRTEAVAIDSVSQRNGAIVYRRLQWRRRAAQDGRCRLASLLVHLF